MRLTGANQRVKKTEYYPLTPPLLAECYSRVLTPWHVWPIPQTHLPVSEKDLGHQQGQEQQVPKAVCGADVIISATDGLSEEVTLELTPK